MMSAEYEKDPIIICQKNINPKEKHNQDLQANLGTAIHSTSCRIGGRQRIYHKVTDIQMPLVDHQGQDFYIWN